MCQHYLCKSLNLSKTWSLSRVWRWRGQGISNCSWKRSILEESRPWVQRWMSCKCEYYHKINFLRSFLFLHICNYVHNLWFCDFFFIRRRTLSAVMPPGKIYVFQFLDAPASLGSILESQSLIHVFEILSNLGHIIQVCSGYVLGMFKVCSE